MKILIVAAAIITYYLLNCSLIYSAESVKDVSKFDSIEHINANKRFEDSVNSKLNDITTALMVNNEKVESAKRNSDTYLQSINTLVTSILGLVTLVLGLGVYKLYKENKRIITEAEDELKIYIETWKKNKINSIDAEFNKITNKYELTLQNYLNYLLLRDLITKSNVTPEEIYPLLTPLVENPQLIYKPLFVKLYKLNINSDITNRVKSGLKNL